MQWMQKLYETYIFPDKTIKLWKIFEKSIQVVSENTLDANGRLPIVANKPCLRLPKLSYQDTIIAAFPRKIFSNAHAYHIHSISVNSDGETYLSADDLRVNLWNLEISNQSFSMRSSRDYQRATIPNSLDSRYC
jgi:serine/threonine-protein phosphatase 2A regulatory subunit B